MHLEERERPIAEGRHLKDAVRQEEKEREALERHLKQTEGEKDQGANYPYIER